MLVRVLVKNFRNFEDWVDVDLKTTKNYEFNTFATSNGIVQHGMIYGKNGGGKSNLGLALLDITCHLNDMSSNTSLTGLSNNYQNANTVDDLVEFKYFFNFNGVEVVYCYGKESVTRTVYEHLEIDGRACIDLDRRDGAIGRFNLDGSESLKNDFSGTSISALKYLNANVILDDNTENTAFKALMAFVKGMVFFRTLNKRSEHHGVQVETQRLSKEIIDSGSLGDFELFLNESGIECSLKQAGSKGDERIDFVFGERNIEFSQAASSGTQSLGVFYYWWLKLKSGELTFAYIDEFDAFYHHALSKQIVKKLSSLDCQTLLTTHNTTIMSNDLLRPDCYFEIKEGGGSVELRPFFTLINKELRKAHNLEKIYKGLANG